jgi:DNA-directed RNA polymerase subunit RPC12/RpoP
MLNCTNDRFYLCLECGKEFENTLKIAVCPKCLEHERKNFKKGIKSKYQTVMMLLNSSTKK